MQAAVAALEEKIIHPF